VSYPPNSSPGAADEAWTTPARPPGPVVTPSPATHEMVQGGQPIAFPGDADPGGRDTVAASVAQAQANAEARYHELQGDTYGQGSQIGDTLELSQPPSGPGVGLSDVDLPVKGLGY
jgi:hypothetical protein